jgi:hypothetical protein
VTRGFPQWRIPAAGERGVNGGRWLGAEGSPRVTVAADLAAREFLSFDESFLRLM